jgi:hypothetical protein
MPENEKKPPGTGGASVEAEVTSELATSEMAIQ